MPQTGSPRRKTAGRTARGQQAVSLLSGFSRAEKAGSARRRSAGTGSPFRTGRKVPSGQERFPHGVHAPVHDSIPLLRRHDTSAGTRNKKRAAEAARAPVQAAETCTGYGGNAAVRPEGAPPWREEQ